MADLFSQTSDRPRSIEAAVRSYAEAGHEERGAVYTRDGQLVASVAQEGLMRIRG